MSGDEKFQQDPDDDDQLDEHYSSCESMPSSPKDETKTRETSTNEASNNSTNVIDSGDMFLQLLDIAVATKKAQSQAHCAKDKVNFIGRLYQCAKEEALGLHEVAESLAKTAASVAVIALQICQYKSYADAFKAKPKYSERISLEEFMEIIKPYGQDIFIKEALPRLPPFPTNPNVLVSEATDALLPPSSSTVLKSRIPTYEKSSNANQKIDPNTADASKASGSGRSTQGRLDSGPFYEEPRLQPINHENAFTTSTRVNSENFSEAMPAKGTRRSSLPTNPACMYQALIDNEQLQYLLSGSGSSLTRFGPKNEPFPPHVTPSDMRDILASTFDSNLNLSPLWEDRYLPAGQKNSSPPVTPKDQSWSDKKQFKQFQMKLQSTLNSPPGSLTSCDDRNASTEFEPSNQDTLPIETTNTRKSPRENQRRARQEDAEISSSESELDELLSDNRPVIRVKKFEKKDVASKSLQPGVAHSLRPISPLLSNSEKDHCKERQPTSPKIPAKQTFQPHMNYSSSEGSRSSGREDDL